ncbi:ABC transporter permease [Siminovitchia fortis]|uniref:ABC transporter permease n=1 Tax=Siminovitchia fortis TaxID=254758 RepID=A0A443IY06_9BACI|nr:ABC transporter permease [Siminovitchia fortis]RWR12898.1 ABC transporter permease [Siminovitchia fortis]WHY80443.1 ABC transporter permease [Siminovitchia fortis]
MFNLVRNEWEKIFRQKSTFIMIGFLILIVFVNAGITKYLEGKERPSGNNWKQELMAENESLKQESDGVQIMTPSMKEFIHKQVAVNEYRIKNDLPPVSKSTVWTFINDSAGLIPFAGLFVLIIAAGIVANEFSWGTIKVLLVKPYKRWKILLSKYIAVNLFLLLMLIVLFVFSGIAGAVLFGTGEAAANVHLAYVNGRVEEQSLFLYLIKSYAFSSLSIFLLVAMAFMISAVFRSSALAIGLSVFLLFTGGTITNLLASKFEWAKYSLFANTNLMQYVDGLPMVESMTMKFSVIILLIYFSLFHISAFAFFTRRDIAA